ncbi:HAD family hydrolase [Clostridium isatidis]|uniref:HAD family hydrolase n=1 Tax=Clostridium isatidis TaxID=182773 RepID=A0A343J9I3_9CLOT|nr:HAD family phosphatase [Clostridium isatidis]ASW42191.1 HAD family hydrolase [Clostridium isatidis]NLZ35023.1 HAD family phosphatase [Clostridiales bacterium]
MKGVIFDFNGTMLFDSDKQEKAWRMYIKKMIGRDVSDEEFKERVHGRNNSDILEYFSGKKLTEQEIDEMGEEKEVIYRRLCLEDKENFKLVEGVEELLNYLKENNIPFTIATASGRKNVEFFFENLNLDKWFNLERVVYSDGTIKGKPNPDIYLKAAEIINMAPKDCLVFEDAKSGIIAAERAGIGKIIAIASTSEPEYFNDIKAVSKVIRDFTGFKDYI